jgi:hypothetical protein
VAAHLLVELVVAVMAGLVRLVLLEQQILAAGVVALVDREMLVALEVLA